MLSKQENELLTRTGPGTPMGNAMRRYWVPACLSSEIDEPDGAPVRVETLGRLRGNIPSRAIPKYIRIWP